MRPSEVVVSTVVLFLSPCCPGLDWWRRISTSDLTQQRVDEEKRAVGNTGDRDRAADLCDTTLRLFRLPRAGFVASCPVFSPGHVDFSVAGSASHFAEGNPDAHSHHQGEGNHSSNHISSATFRGKQVSAFQCITYSHSLNVHCVHLHKHFKSEHVMFYRVLKCL